VAIRLEERSMKYTVDIVGYDYSLRGEYDSQEDANYYAFLLQFVDGYREDEIEIKEVSDGIL